MILLRAVSLSWHKLLLPRVPRARFLFAVHDRPNDWLLFWQFVTFTFKYCVGIVILMWVRGDKSHRSSVGVDLRQCCGVLPSCGYYGVYFTALVETAFNCERISVWMEKYGDSRKSLPTSDPCRLNLDVN